MSTHERASVYRALMWLPMPAREGKLREHAFQCLWGASKKKAHGRAGGQVTRRPVARRDFERALFMAQSIDGYWVGYVFITLGIHLRKNVLRDLVIRHQREVRALAQHGVYGPAPQVIDYLRGLVSRFLKSPEGAITPRPARTAITRVPAPIRYTLAA